MTLPPRHPWAPDPSESHEDAMSRISTWYFVGKRPAWLGTKMATAEGVCVETWFVLALMAHPSGSYKESTAAVIAACESGRLPPPPAMRAIFRVGGVMAVRALVCDIFDDAPEAPGGAVEGTHDSR